MRHTILVFHALLISKTLFTTETHESLPRVKTRFWVHLYVSFPSIFQSTVESRQQMKGEGSAIKKNVCCVTLPVLSNSKKFLSKFTVRLLYTDNKGIKLLHTIHSFIFVIV